MKTIKKISIALVFCISLLPIFMCETAHANTNFDEPAQDNSNYSMKFEYNMLTVQGNGKNCYLNDENFRQKVIKLCGDESNIWYIVFINVNHIGSEKIVLFSNLMWITFNSNRVVTFDKMAIHDNVKLGAIRFNYNNDKLMENFAKTIPEINKNHSIFYNGEAYEKEDYQTTMYVYGKDNHCIKFRTLAGHDEWIPKQN